jgi:hypothetical protein
LEAALHIGGPAGRGKLGMTGGENSSAGAIYTFLLAVCW